MQGVAVPGSPHFGKLNCPPHKETSCPTIITSASNAAPPCADRTFTAGGRNPRRTAPNAANAAYKLAIPPKRHKYAWRQLQAVMQQYRQERCAFFDSRPYERLAALERQFRAWNAKFNHAQTENQRNAFRRETARCLQAMADIEKEINRFHGFTVR